jgi:hypothetical protein
MVIQTKDWINGLVSLSLHTATTRRGAMSTSGTTASHSGSSCQSGAIPTVPFQSTACGHPWTTHTTEPRVARRWFQYACRTGSVPGGNQRRPARSARSTPTGRHAVRGGHPPRRLGGRRVQRRGAETGEGAGKQVLPRARPTRVATPSATWNPRRWRRCRTRQLGQLLVLCQGRSSRALGREWVVSGRRWGCAGRQRCPGRWGRQAAPRPRRGSPVPRRRPRPR